MQDALEVIKVSETISLLQDGVGQTASLGLRKQKAMELARACRASHFRALLRQRRQGSSEAPLLERVMEQIATAMVCPSPSDRQLT